MSKIDKFWRREKSTVLALQFGVDLSKFNVIHFGSMGPANGLQYLVDTALELKQLGDTQIQIILMGHGGTKEKLQNFCAKHNLNNVSFISRQPMPMVSEIVNMCDVSVVSFKNVPILATNSPNKLFDSLSAGVPVVVNSAGWTKDLVEKGKCGAFVDPENPKELAQLLMEWRQMPELLLEMGYNSRLLAEHEYDKSIACPKFGDIIEQAKKKAYV